MPSVFTFSCEKVTIWCVPLRLQTYTVSGKKHDHVSTYTHHHQYQGNQLLFYSAAGNRHPHAGLLLPLRGKRWSSRRPAGNRFGNTGHRRRRMDKSPAAKGPCLQKSPRIHLSEHPPPTAKPQHPRQPPRNSRSHPHFHGTCRLFLALTFYENPEFSGAARAHREKRSNRLLHGGAPCPWARH